VGRGRSRAASPVRGERRRDYGDRPAEEGPQRGLGGQRFVLLDLQSRKR